jgi:hypothetical protein
LTVPILVPWRPDGGHRDRLWEFTREWWAWLGWPIIEGHDTDGLFNRGKAINTAAVEAGDWDVALIIDGDVILGEHLQYVDAVARARETGQLTFAHSEIRDLSQQGTARLQGGWKIDEFMVERTEKNTYSSALAVPRSLWDDVGGFDERLAGWGWDDWAFFAACDVMGGGHQRIPGPVYHLWHPRVWESREGHPAHAANQALGRLYLASRGSREKMRAVLDGTVTP